LISYTKYELVVKWKKSDRFYLDFFYFERLGRGHSYVGHTFISIDKFVNGQNVTRTFGYYPKGWATPGFPSSDEWLEHLRVELGNYDLVSVKKHDKSKGLEFGISSYKTKRTESLAADDIYEVTTDDSPSVLFVCVRSDNKIVSFAGYQIGQKVGMIEF
jgi:hypothetical protein